MRFTLRTSFIGLAIFAFVLACVCSLLRNYVIEQRARTEIENAGGHVGCTLFGWVDRADSDRWTGEPKWLHRIVGVRISGTQIDDERLGRLPLQRFEHLRELFIGYDAIYGLEGPKWESPPAPITNKGLAALPAFPKLRGLYLANMQVGQTGLKDIAQKFPLLEKLELSGTQVTDTAMAEVGQLQELTWLDLNNSAITDKGISRLTKLQRLEIISLYQTSVTGSALAELAKFAELKNVRLDNNNIATLPPEIGNFAKLTSLNLWNNQITELPPEIGKLKSLFELNLDNNPITDADLEQLKSLENLRTLWLNGTNVTKEGVADLKEGVADLKEGVADLKKALPYCNIYSDFTFDEYPRHSPILRRPKIALLAYSAR
jgi:hypothetical protein